MKTLSKTISVSTLTKRPVLFYIQALKTSQEVENLAKIGAKHTGTPIIRKETLVAVLTIMYTVFGATATTVALLQIGIGVGYINLSHGCQ